MFRMKIIKHLDNTKDKIMVNTIANTFGVLGGCSLVNEVTLLNLLKQ